MRRLRIIVFAIVVPALMSVTACLWQKRELHRVYTDGHIPYGHFREASAKGERLRIVSLPLTTVSMVFVAYAAISSAVFLRQGLRWSILLFIFWMFVAYMPFGIYNLVLAAQGDGSVFI